jgi:hypothetical protein
MLALKPFMVFHMNVRFLHSLQLEGLHVEVLARPFSACGRTRMCCGRPAFWDESSPLCSGRAQRAAGRTEQRVSADDGEQWDHAATDDHAANHYTTANHHTTTDDYAATG